MAGRGTKGEMMGPAAKEPARRIVGAPYPQCGNNAPQHDYDACGAVTCCRRCCNVERRACALRHRYLHGGCGGDRMGDPQQREKTAGDDRRQCTGYRSASRAVFPAAGPAFGGTARTGFCNSDSQDGIRRPGTQFFEPGARRQRFLRARISGRVRGCGAGIPSGGNMVLDFVMGHQSGWIGGFSAGALLAGAIVLRCLRIINVTLPVAFAGSAYVLFRCFGGADAAFYAMAGIGTGGLLLCAFFMATDPVTSPKNVPARFLFGAGCGVLTFIFRKFGSADDGVAYAVLIMNLSVPYLDRYWSRVRKRCATN